MIVEVLGATSSGKSTYIRDVINQSINNKVAISTFNDLEPNLLMLLLRDLRSVFYFLVFSKHRFGVARFIKICLHRDDALWMRLNLFRNLLKKYGEIEYFRRTCAQKIVLIDEGPVHALTNILCHYNRLIDADEAKIYFNSIVAPDFIIKVVCSQDEMLRRAKTRPDPPWKNLKDWQWRNLFLNTANLYKLILEKISWVPIIEIDSKDPDVIGTIGRLTDSYLSKNRDG